VHLLLERADALLHSDTQSTLLRWSVELREFSPAVEAHRALGAQAAEALSQLPGGECTRHAYDSAEPWAYVSGPTVRVVCGVRALSELRLTPDSASSAVSSVPSSHAWLFAMLPTDHLLPESAPTHTPRVVLHADVGTRDAYVLYERLAPRARAGEFQLVWRHHTIEDRLQRAVALQGYGAELHLKNMEYKAMDDTEPSEEEGQHAQHATASPGEESAESVGGVHFARLRERRPELEAELSLLQGFLRAVAKSDSDTVEAFEQMRPWEVRSLGLRAAQRVFAAHDPLRILRELTHNFPTAAESLARIQPSEALRAYLRQHEGVLQGGRNLLTVNGRNVPADHLHPFALRRLVAEELSKANALLAMRIAPEHVRGLLTGQLQRDSEQEAAAEQTAAGGSLALEPEARFDLRDAPARYLNNLMRDSPYASYAPLRDLADPSTHRGAFAFVRHNLLTMQVVVDPSTLDGLSALGNVVSLMQQGFPLRFAVLVVAAPGSDLEAVALFGAALEALAGSRGPAYGAYVLSALANDLLEHGLESVDGEMARQLLLPLVGPDLLHDEEQVEAARERALDTAALAVGRLRLPLAEQGALVLLNGVLLESVSDRRGLMRVAQADRTRVQQLLAGGLLRNQRPASAILDALLGHASQHLLPCYCALAYPSKAAPLRFLPLAEEPHRSLHGALRFVAPPHAVDSVKLYSLVVVGDFARADACLLTHAALQHLAIDLQQVEARVALLQNGERGSPPPPLLAAVHAALSSQLSRPAFELVLALLEAGAQPQPDALAVAARVLADPRREAKFAAALLLGEYGAHEAARDTTYCQGELALEPHQRVVLLNGRVLQLPEAGGELEPSDFDALLAHHAARVTPLRATLDRLRFEAVPADELTAEFRSTVAAQLVATLGVEEVVGASKLDLSEVACFWSSSEQRADAAGAPVLLEVTAVIDPVSERTPQLVSQLIRLLELFPAAAFRLALNPAASLEERPLTFFYRAASEALSFEEEDGRLREPCALFSRMPPSRLMTVNLQTLPNWVVTASRARYDLDNIRLADMAAQDRVLTAHFSLENLLLHGACHDADTWQPPQGLQLLLGAGAAEQLQDTLVMQNMGYFQLKANPGAWVVRTAQGRARTIYQTVEHSAEEVAPLEPELEQSDAGVRFAVTSFVDETRRLLVRRRAGAEHLPLLEADADLDAHDDLDLFGRFGLGQRVGLAADEREPDGAQAAVALLPPAEKLHVFSVASGHLYERFLKIMVLSVVQNTETPVKFWFLKNFLSPEFKEFIVYMAEEVGFEVELVTYQWPPWLNPQTEKQRKIWAYKILFLDVLFPLSVDKIVFVDADQVVRTDLQELFRIDLQGAPYGYTPMCDSRSEMEGFRFWNRGFWEKHLAGSPYHISALYVVDLARLRRLAGGDILRSTYHSLSQDPNSLSNLDQDLPNYLQHQVGVWGVACVCVCGGGGGAFIGAHHLPLRLARTHLCVVRMCPSVWCCFA
jgi:UDP-glucose:glycoprotein glucosyltransferase